MPTDLSPDEKDDKHLEHLLDRKKPAPSRKHTERRGPKHDNRVQVRIDDPDLDARHSETTSSNLADVALHIHLYPATSNKVSSSNMGLKTSTYHGIVQQGHPTDSTNTGWKSLDKRHFGEKHYDSILKSAKSLLDDDWLKYNWDGGSPDAQVRAALDLAIHTADSSLYQSKIDVETYDMLLNRLANWGHDTFSDTLLPMKAKSRTAMNRSYHEVVRIANDIRKTNPRAALDILASLQSAPEVQPTVSQEQSYGHLDMFKLKGETKKLGDAKSPDEFADGLKALGEMVSKQASDVALNVDLDKDTEALESMSDEEMGSWLDKAKASAKELEKAAESGDMEMFTKALEDIMKQSEEAAKQVHTGSTLVKLSTLVKIAHENPQTRAILLPILAAAKKKDEKKKKDKKTSQKKETSAEKEDDKEEKTAKGKKDKKPFGGKQAPPFGGKKSSPFKKKSSDLSEEDSVW